MLDEVIKWADILQHQDHLTRMKVKDEGHLHLQDNHDTSLKAPKKICNETLILVGGGASRSLPGTQKLSGL